MKMAALQKFAMLLLAATWLPFVLLLFNNLLLAHENTLLSGGQSVLIVLSAVHVFPTLLFYFDRRINSALTTTR